MGTTHRLSILGYQHLFLFGASISDEEIANVFGTGTSVGCIAVVAVDQTEQTGGRERELGAFVVACRCSHTSHFVAIDWHASNVELSASYALIRFALLAYSQCQVLAHYLVGIEAADAVGETYRREVDEIDHGADGIEVLVLKQATAELFVRRTVAVGLLATSLVALSGGLDAASLLDGVDGEVVAQPTCHVANLCPEVGIGLGIIYWGEQGTANKVGTGIAQFIRNGDFHYYWGVLGEGTITFVNGRSQGSIGRELKIWQEKATPIVVPA